MEQWGLIVLVVIVVIVLEVLRADSNKNKKENTSELKVYPYN